MARLGACNLVSHLHSLFCFISGTQWAVDEVEDSVISLKVGSARLHRPAGFVGEDMLKVSVSHMCSYVCMGSWMKYATCLSEKRLMKGEESSDVNQTHLSREPQSKPRPGQICWIAIFVLTTISNTYDVKHHFISLTEYQSKCPIQRDVTTLKCGLKISCE